jgi:integrase
VSAKTREEVREKYLALHQAARRGSVAPKVPSLETYLAGWLADVVEPSLAPKTVANYQLFCRYYIVPLIGTKRLDKLNVRDVKLWLNHVRTRCQCCAQGKDAARKTPRCCAIGQCCQQRASDWTSHQALRVLRSALSEAVRDELVGRNVASMVRANTPRSNGRSFWSVEDARRFLESSNRDRDPLHAAYVLMLALGLRRGELLGLMWSAIDLVAGEARILRQLQRVNGQLVLRQTKTKSSDSPLPLPALCTDALRAQQAETERRRAAAGDAWHDTGLVFTTRYGLPYEPRNFYRQFRIRAAKAGVPVVSVHSTRRTCASLLVELDIHPRVAMQILRHSQIAVTMDIYSQVTSASTRAALARLGSWLDFEHPE